MTDRPRRAIAWFRRDLRVSDNRMLAAATEAADLVHPVFVADPAILRANATATPRVAWFGATLGTLDARLQREGSGLTVLAGEPATILRDFAARVEADAVFAARDEDPSAVARDATVADAVALRLVDDQRLLPPGTLRTGEGEAFRVYTPFRRALDRCIDEEGDRLVAPATADLRRLAPHVHGTRGADEFPAPPAWLPFPAVGEEAAGRRLADFARHDLRRYRSERDRPDLDTTSRISPHLRVGSLSVRAAWRAALEAERRAVVLRDRELQESARRWRDELAWREFYANVLQAHPRVATGSFRPEFDKIGWEEGPLADEALAAWRAGMTGYPIVDAGMRQLAATGWMHNRLRLITASFLVKDLGIDWRAGESAFMEHLLDGDLAQNNGNWQWVAGVGTDAAPYFRVFNPVVQGKRFDPDGAFVRAWLPELDDLPATWVHEPWLAPDSRRPRDYPAPIVDHAGARSRTLERYGVARAG